MVEIFPNAVFIGLDEAEVRAALADAGDNPIAVEVARLVAAYGANFAEHARRGRMPESILRRAPNCAIERVAMELTTLAIRAAVPASDMLAAIGRALHGEHWLGGLAADLKVNERTIRAWMNDRDVLNAQHRVFDDALALCRDRSDQLLQAAAALEGWIKANCGGTEPNAETARTKDFHPKNPPFGELATQG